LDDRFYMKELYRANYISPRRDPGCTASGAFKKDDVKCGFECNDAVTSSQLSAKLKKTISPSYVPSDLTDAQWEGWKDVST
jgi:hypothetical protein